MCNAVYKTITKHIRKKESVDSSQKSSCDTNCSYKKSELQNFKCSLSCM